MLHDSSTLSFPTVMVLVLLFPTKLFGAGSIICGEEKFDGLWKDGVSAHGFFLKW